MRFYQKFYPHLKSKAVGTALLKIDQSTITEKIFHFGRVFLESWICQDIALYLLALLGLKVHWILKTMECHHI